MEKADSISFCKYYKGEQSNPYKNPIAWYIWEIEKEWVEDMARDYLENYRPANPLSHYIALGYWDFESFDDTPVTLKARLFTLLEHWNEGVVTRDSFSDFYAKWKEHKF